MDSKKITEDLILCRSKTYPGRSYYYNVVSGRAIWKADDDDIKKNSNIQVASESHYYPEPDSVSNEEFSPDVSASSSLKNPEPPIQCTKRSKQQTSNGIQPAFRQAVFPNYFQNMFQDMPGNMLPITWMPIMPMFMMNQDVRSRSSITPKSSCNQFTKRCEPFTAVSEDFKNNEGFIPSTPTKEPSFPILDWKRKRYRSESHTEVPNQAVFSKKNKNDSNFEQNSSLGKFSKSCENLNKFGSNDVPITKDFFKASTDKWSATKEVRDQNHNYREMALSTMSDESVCYRMSTLSTSNKVQNSKNKVNNPITTSTSSSIFLKAPQFPSFRSISSGYQSKENSDVISLTNKNKFNQKATLVFENTGQNTNSQIKSRKDGVEKTVGKFNKSSNCHTVVRDRSMPVVVEKNETLSQRSKVDHECDDSNSLDNLDETDLRFLLVARRRKSVEAPVSHGMPDKRQKMATPTPAKKRVTFDLEEEETVNCEIDDTNQISSLHNLRNDLNKLAVTSMKTDVWYILVDMSVMLLDFEFLHGFIKADEKCRLYIPSALHRNVKRMCTNVNLSRELVMAARQVNRWITPLNTHVQVQCEESAGDPNEMSLNECLIDCCLDLMSRNYHVVLITIDSNFKSKATSIGLNVHTIDEVKNGAARREQVRFDIRKINPNNNDIMKEQEREESIIPKRIFRNASHSNDNGVLQKKELSVQMLNKQNTSFLNETRNLNCEREEEEIEKECFFRKGQNQNDLPFFYDTGRLESDGEETEKEIHFQKSLKTLLTDDKKEDNLSAVKEVESLKNELVIQAKGVNVAAKEKFDLDFELNNAVCDRIKDKIEEYICIFTQIMEDCLSELLLCCKNFKIQPPWDLHESVQCASDMFGQDELVKLYSDSLVLMLFYNCDKYGKLKRNMTPAEFAQLFICGLSLIKSLKKIVSRKEIINDAEVLLENLQNKIKYGFSATDSLFDFCEPNVKASTSKEDLLDIDNSRHNYVKPRMEIIRFLKQHYEDWKSYNENDDIPQNEKNPEAKVLRTSGRNLKLLQIDKEKQITMEIERDIDKDNQINVIGDELVHGNTFDSDINDKRKPVKVFKPIKAFEDKIKRTVTSSAPVKVNQVPCETENAIDIDSSARPAFYRSEAHTATNHVKSTTEFDRSNVKQTANGGVDERHLTVVTSSSARNEVEVLPAITDDNMTLDSGFDTDSCAPVKTFLTEMGGVFRFTYRFIKKYIKEFHKHESNGERKRKLHNQMNSVQNNMAEIINQLQSIISRESHDGTTLKAYLTRTGDNYRDDYRITKYRQVIIKCHEQAQVLGNALSLILNMMEGRDVAAISDDIIEVQFLVQN